MVQVSLIMFYHRLKSIEHHPLCEPKIPEDLNKKFLHSNQTFEKIYLLITNWATSTGL